VRAYQSLAGVVSVSALQQVSLLVGVRWSVSACHLRKQERLVTQKAPVLAGHHYSKHDLDS
jgi:hypothetical protein